MRFLQQDETGQLGFSVFREHDIPPYAIRFYTRGSQLKSEKSPLM